MKITITIKNEKIIATDKTIKEIVKNEIKRLGLTADLNHIDTSQVTDMTYLFGYSKFNGDISQWNVSKVKNMHSMFYGSKFNQDISKWNVSKVKNMSYMFFNSKFNQDISQWNVSNVENMDGMFDYSEFNQDISKWNVSKVKNMSYMFFNSKFNQDISNWDVSNVVNMENIFLNSFLDCLHNKEYEYFNIFNKKESNYIKLIEQLIENKIDFGQDFISIINQLRKLEGLETLVYDFENQKLKL